MNLDNFNDVVKNDAMDDVNGDIKIDSLVWLEPHLAKTSDNELSSDDEDFYSDGEIICSDDPIVKNDEKKYIIKIFSNNSFYKSITNYICNLYLKQQSIVSDVVENNSIELDYYGVVRMKNNRYKVKYDLPIDKPVTVKIENTNVECCVRRITDAHSVEKHIDFLYEMTLTTNNKNVIDRLFVKYKYNSQLQKRSIHLYTSNGRNWTKYGSIDKKYISPIVLDKKTKAMVFDDVKKFIDSKLDYKKYRIPYKRNYLFYGRSGSGKTALVNHLAHMLNRSIYVISFDAILTNKSLIAGINSIDRPAFVLIDNIDLLFAKDKSPCTLSTILTILDGIKIKGIITIITASRIDILDAAIIRSGRIDKLVKFDNVVVEQITEFFKLYNVKVNNTTFKQFQQICQKKELSSASISEFLFGHRDTLNDETLISLFEEYLKEIDDAMVKNKHQNMYM
jgi:hypothetical protein